MKCGKPLVLGTRFCGECGAGIAETASTIVPVPPVEPERSVAATYESVLQKKPLSAWQGVMIAAGLLVLLVGLGAVLGESATPLAGLMVLGTTVWACIDSYRIRRLYKAKDTTAHPVGLFLCMTLLWIVIFPWYLVTRSGVLAKLGTVPLPVAPPAQEASQSLSPPNADEIGPVVNYSKAYKWVGPLIAVLMVVYGMVNHNVSETFRKHLQADASWADVVKSFFTFRSGELSAATTVEAAAPQEAAAIPIGENAASAPVSSTAGACLSYGPAVVKLTGTITPKTFPGKPNFESLEKGDEPENVWILALAAPSCTNEQKNGNDTIGAEADVRELQLSLGDQQMYDRYRPLLGRMVNVTGSLDHAIPEDGHHHTLVMLSVASIEP